MSRLDSGAETIECEPLDLRESARTAVESYRPRAEAEGLSIDLELPDTPVTARANREAVGQVLDQLLDNAIKFTDTGGSIWLRVRAETGAAAMAVEDTGVGIAEEAQDEIFGAFDQESKGLDRQYEGSGLGLTVARLLACEMGGHIEVDAERRGQRVQEDAGRDAERRANAGVGSLQSAGEDVHRVRAGSEDERYRCREIREQRGGLEADE